MSTAFHNPNCDGSHCRSNSGEVRVLPLGGGANNIVCQACFEHEMRYRRQRNRDLGGAMKFDIPGWMDLTVYGGAAT